MDLADAAVGLTVRDHDAPVREVEVTQAQESVAAASETYIGAFYTHNLAKASLARAVGTAEQSVMSFLGGSR